MSLVPESWRELDSLLPRWAIRRHRERVRARLAADIGELTALQAAVLPHLKSIIETLDAYPLDQIPAELEPYGQLALTVAAYDLAVNRFGQVDVPYAYPLEKIVFLDADQPKRWE